MIHMNFEKQLKRIDHRNWKTIRAEWFQYLPNIQAPGQHPDHEIAQTVGLDDVVARTPETGEYKTELIGLRAAIFHEGIFLLHKAFHVSGSAEVHINNGILSWSLSSGYHSAFFAVKSIMCFLGISTTEVNNKMILIDVWPEPEKLSKSKVNKGFTPKREMKFLSMPKLQHFHIWEIFQRILRTSTINIWPETFRHLIALNPKDFALQRNTLHYKNNKWIHDDLYKSDLDPHFGIRTNLLDEIDDVDPLSDDFSILLSHILLNLAYILLKDIAQDAPIISSEFALIEKSLDNDHHDLYKETISF